MRRYKHAIAVMLWLLPGPALAWGPEGHEVVAHLAARNLTAKARAQVAALLGGEAEAAMAIAANWADEIRDDRPQTSSWHFVNIEIDRGASYDAARDCPGGNCVVQQISRFEAVLKSRAPRARKAEALRFLIHFVGDIHQPLHAADRHDRGGNTVRVFVRPGRPESLHHVWDDDVVAALGRDPATVARRIDDGVRPAQKAALMAPGAPAAWAQASAVLARDVAYAQLRNGNHIDARMLAADAQVARGQLARAGYALAGMLNRALR
jgi:hypothetical protein